MNYRKIALIGMMGSGKSVLSKLLAAELGLKCFEADEIFELQNSMKIKDYFKKFGEDSFRKKETQILKEILKLDSFVLSTGGGVILSDYNRELLFNDEIFSIYLKASPETIYSRIKCDNTRPLLLVENPKEEIKKILKIRESLYAKAKCTIMTDNKDLNEIAKEILKYGRD